MKVMVSKEDAWKLDTSMFIVEGSWETGYTFDDGLFLMVGVTSYYTRGCAFPISFGIEPSTMEMETSLLCLSTAQNWLELGEREMAGEAISRALYWLREHLNQ